MNHTSHRNRLQSRGLLRGLTCLAFTVTPVHAVTRTWDAGGGADNKWTTAANWDANTLPAANNDVVIDTAATVDMNGLGSGNLPSGVKVALTNGSTLTNSTNACRMNGASSVSVGSGCTLDKYWAMYQGSMSFQEGAKWTAGDVELAGPNVFSFKLGPAGFTKLTPGTLRWNSTTKFSQQTWNVDMADYTGPSPASIILMDCSSAADAAMTSALWLAQATRNVTSAGANVGSTIVYDPVQAAFVLKVQVAAYVPPVADLVWDGGGGSALWTTATNWDPDFAPATGNAVAIASPVTVDCPDVNLPACTVSLTNNAGLTCSAGAVRLQGATIHVASGSSLSANFWDMNNGTINFQNGAVASVPSWELKGTTRFTFKLGAAGFTKLTPGALWGSTIATSTWVADMADYTGGTGIIPLVDFATDSYTGGMSSTVFLTSTRSVTNPGLGYAANLQYNDSTETVELNVTAAPGAPTPLTYFWDNNGAAAGFGRAAGIWAAPTTGNDSQGWSTNTNGGALALDVTTTLSDTVNFGNGATGLGAGNITNSDTVSVGNMTFASGSGDIDLTGGTINLPAVATITAGNSADSISSVLAGAATSLTKAGPGHLILSGANALSGGTMVSDGTLQVGAGGTTGSLGTGAMVNNANLVYDLANSATAALPSRVSGSGKLTATAGCIEFNGNITLGGGQSYASGGAWPNSMRMTANTILSGSALSMTGMIGQDTGNSYNLALDTSAANGPINLAISIGQSGRYYGFNSFTVNAGTGTVTLTGAPARWDSVSNSITGALAISSSFNPTGPLTLRATAASTITGNIGLAAATTQSFTVDSGVTMAISGALSGAGAAITKLGAGTLTINAANTATGPMAVNAGTLGVSITDSTDNTRQWSCASLSFNNSGTGLNFNFSSYVAPSTSVAPLKVLGAVAFTNTPAVTVNLGYNVGPANTQHPLMTWTSQSGTVPTAVTVTAPAPGVVTGHLAVSGNTLYLVIDSVSNMTDQSAPRLGLFLAFNSTGVPTSVTNSTGVELLSGTSSGFYLLETNNVKRYFNQVTDLGGGACRFGMVGSPEQIVVQFARKNDYLTCRFTSMSDFALQGERLYFGLTSTKLKALALDHMVAASNGASSVQVERVNLWEQVVQSPINLSGGFAVYHNISPAQEDSTLIDLWTMEGLPHPKVAGNWDRAAAEAWLTNWINAAYDTSYLNIVPNNLSEHYTYNPYAAKMDAKAIYMWNLIWRGEYWLQYRQNDEINPIMYPNGLADVQAFKNSLGTDGRTLMFHYLSGNIGEEDPEFAKPNVSGDLQSWGTVTLTAPMTTTATTMIVQPAAGVKLPVIGGNLLLGPPAIPSYFDFKTFRIGNEWMSASSVTDLGNGTWQLNGVTRGQWHTTTQGYSSGTSLRGYLRPYNQDFVPDPDSPLLTTIAARWATLNNTLGLRCSEFDGLENHAATGNWGTGKFTAQVYENLDHPTVSNTSGGRPPEAWLEYRFNRVKDALGGSFQTRQHASFYLGDASWITPGIEEVENEMNKFFNVNNRGFSLGSYDVKGVAVSTLTTHGLTDEVLALLKSWKNASLPMSATQRAAMNTFRPYLAARLAINGNHPWATALWRPDGSRLRKWYALGTDNYTHEWHYGQEHGSITPRFYVTNGQTQTLEVPAALSSGAQQTRIIGRVLPRFDDTNTGNINLMPYLGTTNFTVTRTNTTGADVWDDTQLTKHVISPPRDLSANRGLGLWVTGDNSGATLVLRLQRSTQSRDHVVPINFTGRRWIEIPTGEQGWRVKNWGWAMATIHSLDYRYIDSIRIGIGHIPANTTCSVVVDGLVAMKETAEALVNPTISLGGQSAGVSGTIASGNHFSLDPSGLFTIYNANWNVVSTQQLSGLLPASLTSFSMQSASSSPNIWLEVGVQASNETTSSPAYTSTWDGGGADGLWTTAANWSGNVLPVAGKAIDINSTVTVDALGLGSGNLPSLATLNISGGATLTMSSGVIRLNGSTLNVASTGALAGAFWDLNNGTINFEAGAGATMNDWEQKGANVFGYKLSANGFTPLTPGRLRSGNSAVWSNATYNINISAYNIANGTTIVLADYASHDAAFNGTFNPTVNITAGASGLSASLAFDTVNSKLVLTIDAAGNDAPVARSQTVATPVNTPVNVVLRATDPESDPLAFTIVNGPLHGTLTGSGSNRLYTPSANFIGSDTFTFIANDGSLNSNTGMVTMVSTPQTATELWSACDSAIRNDGLNAIVLANWTDGAVTLKQIRYDLGTLAGTPANASPKIAAYYGYPTGGTNLPGIVQIHGGGQRADLNEVKYWAQQGYACISINWGGLPLNDGLPNTDWDGLAAGFARTGVANAIHREPLEPAVYNDGHTLFDVPHPLNNSYLLNSYAARRALTFLSAQSNVNANKLGVTGHSMGGQTTMFTATDSRVSCVTPSVGGSGYLCEDFWGLPGSAVTHHAAVSTAYLDWYKRVASPESYWPNVHCPTLFLEGANDYNAPFDFVVKGMSLQPTNVPQQLAVAPHFNHRFDTPSYAARVLWQKTHLTGTFSFPQRAVAQLNLTQPDGIPVFSVWPDTSTPNTIVSVDIYYGYDRDPLNRFWRDAPAVQTNGHWEGKCPVYSLNEPLVAFAIVTYDCGFDLAMPAGYSNPTRKFSVASDVRTVYPPTLATNSVLATEIHRRAIDDFARGFHDWYALNQGNPVYWEYWTRKLNDPSWQGPAAGNLDFSVATTGSGNTLGIKLVTGSWNETAANTYVAVASVPVAGSNNLSLPVGAFTNVGSGAALASWDNVKQLGLVPGNVVNAAMPAWTGAVPVLSNLRWAGGSFPLVNGVPSAWLAGYGLDETDAVALSDSDHDGLLNWQEYLAGTDPANQASAFKITSVSSAGNQRAVQWQGVAGKTYSVWFSEDLKENSWTLKQTGITGVAPTTNATIPSSGGKGFFRISVEP